MDLFIEGRQPHPETDIYVLTHAAGDTSARRALAAVSKGIKVRPR